MATRAKGSTTTEDDKPICGIVMPISSMGDDYPQEHWSRVRKILERAIARAGMKAQLVWESAEIDVIQARILQNIYENDIIICDLSGLNPNVMLETGLRLSTKMPTVIVTDTIKKPPFDIHDIGYVDYPKDLEYNATEDFIERLKDKLQSIIKAGNKYKSFVENFRFETVTPARIEVGSDEYLKERLDELTSAIRRLEVRSRRNEVSQGSSEPLTLSRSITIIAKMDEASARLVETEIDGIVGCMSFVMARAENEYEFTINIVASSPREMARKSDTVRRIIDRVEREYSENVD